MVSSIFIVLLGLISVISVLLRKAYSLVPATELQRRAQAGNELAVVLHTVVGYGVSLRALLWLAIIGASAICYVLLAITLPAVVAIVVISLLTWLNFVGLPKARVSSLTMTLTKRCTPIVLWLLRYADKPLRVLAGVLGRYDRRPHSGLYEMQDMLNLLDLQSSQADSRITTEEIDLIRRVLTFGDRSVGDCMRPRKHVKTVSAGDAIGPVLLDELHASDQTSFPVKKSSRSDDIVGSLQLGDMTIRSTGIVQNYMVAGASYVHQGDSLADALHAFYQTKRQLFIVVDDDDAYVGTLTLQAVLGTLVVVPDNSSS